PLVLATGAGAHGRVLLGLAVFGGMLAASVIAIFLIPVTFYVVERLVHGHERPKPGAPKPGAPKPSGDGEVEPLAPQPKAVPAHARVERGH
ncbi:MAG: efflux RND transporter permease subunit, partial [Nitrospiraceae bacterium]